MDGGVEQPLAPALGRLAVAGILWDVRDHAGIENALPIVRGIKATIEVEVGPPQVQPNLLGHLLQTFQALGKEYHVRCIHGSHGDGSQHRAVVVDDRDDFLPLLVFVARVANPIAPFLATVLVPSPCSTLVSRCFSAARCFTLAMKACQSDPSSAHLALDRHASEVHCWPFLPALLRTGRDTYRIIRLSGLLISSTLAD
jgi:hypothetical protein